jgi:hypothetical protein
MCIEVKIFQKMKKNLPGELGNPSAPSPPVRNEDTEKQPAINQNCIYILPVFGHD